METKDVMEDLWMMLSNMLKNLVLPLKHHIHIKELTDNAKINQKYSRSLDIMTFHKTPPNHSNKLSLLTQFQLLSKLMDYGSNYTDQESLITVHAVPN